MLNINRYEDFLQIKENETVYECGAMSEDAKMAIKSLCESILCQEGIDYHNDEDNEHTYEGYVNECSGYIRECMGQGGYAGLVKPHAE